MRYLTDPREDIKLWIPARRKGPFPDRLVDWLTGGLILGPYDATSQEFVSRSESTYTVTLVFDVAITRTVLIEEGIVQIGRIVRRMAAAPPALVTNGDTYTFNYTARGRFDDLEPRLGRPSRSTQKLLRRLEPEKT